MQGEMDPVGDADRGADHRQPGQTELADLLDPKEVDRVEVEEIGDRDHDIAQEHAGEHIADSEYQQHGDDDLRYKEDDISWTASAGCGAGFGHAERRRVVRRHPNLTIPSPPRKRLSAYRLTQQK